MKIRNGFVSNSSSSSFVAVISKDAFDEALNKAHPYVQAVVKAMGKDESTLDGMEIVTLGTFNDASDYNIFEDLEINYNGDRLENMDEDDGESYNRSIAFDTFIESIPDGKIVTHSTDW